LLIQELLLRDTHMISRKLVNQKYWNRASADDWDEIARSLEIAGIIKIESIGNEIIFRMEEEQVQKMIQHFAGR